MAIEVGAPALGVKSFSAMFPICLPLSHPSAEARRLAKQQTIRRCADVEERENHPMKKIAFAALAALGIALGTVNFAVPAHAYYYGVSQSNPNQNDGGGGNSN